MVEERPAANDVVSGAQLVGTGFVVAAAADEFAVAVGVGVEAGNTEAGGVVAVVLQLVGVADAPES